jgi:hypothetical protein
VDRIGDRDRDDHNGQRTRDRVVAITEPTHQPDGPDRRPDHDEQRPEHGARPQESEKNDDHDDQHGNGLQSPGIFVDETAQVAADRGLPCDVYVDTRSAQPLA